MITGISLRNFQSWEKLDIDIAPITMFVGRSDAGKSAIRRALTYALQNKGGDGFIRLGKDSCKVGIIFEGENLFWEKPRGKGATYWIIDDEGAHEFTKTGQTVPPEIAERFGFRGIEIDKNTMLWPQLQGQHDPPYIIGESGSKVARILGKFTKLDVLVQAQILARRDAEACRKTGHTAEEQAAAAERDLAALPDVEALKEAYHGLTRRATNLDLAREQVAKAEETLQTYRQWERVVERGNPGAAAERAARARELVALVGLAEATVRDYRTAVSCLADAGISVDTATENLAELRAEYETACQKAGICEACPWKV